MGPRRAAPTSTPRSSTPVGRHHRARPGRVVLRAEATRCTACSRRLGQQRDQVTREIPGVRVADVSGGSSVQLSAGRGAAVPARRTAAACRGGLEVVLRLGLGGRPAAVSVTRSLSTAPPRSLPAPTASTPPPRTRRPRGTPARPSDVATDLRGLTSRPARRRDGTLAHPLPLRRCRGLESSSRTLARRAQLRSAGLRPRAAARAVAGRAPPRSPDLARGEPVRARPRARGATPGADCERRRGRSGSRALVDWRSHGFRALSERRRRPDRRRRARSSSRR